MFYVIMYKWCLFGTETVEIDTPKNIFYQLKAKVDSGLFFNVILKYLFYHTECFNVKENVTSFIKK